MRVLISILVSYLLGSIPFGYLIVSAKTGGDIRETGSGGTGATNVSRRAGKSAGVITLILDALKGALAVSLARLVLGGTENHAWWIGAAGIVAMLGHIFPIWLGFRGGKGEESIQDDLLGKLLRTKRFRRARQAPVAQTHPTNT